MPHQTTPLHPLFKICVRKINLCCLLHLSRQRADCWQLTIANSCVQPSVWGKSTGSFRKQRPIIGPIIDTSMYSCTSVYSTKIVKCMTGVAAPNWLLWASCSHFNVMHSLLNCLMTTAAFCSFVKTVTIRTLRCACSYALNKGVILLEGCHLLEAL